MAFEHIGYCYCPWCEDDDVLVGVYESLGAKFQMRMACDGSHDPRRRACGSYQTSHNKIFANMFRRVHMLPIGEGPPVARREPAPANDPAPAVKPPEPEPEKASVNNEPEPERTRRGTGLLRRNRD